MSDRWIDDVVTFLQLCDGFGQSTRFIMETFASEELGVENHLSEKKPARGIFRGTERSRMPLKQAVAFSASTVHIQITNPVDRKSVV